MNELCLIHTVECYSVMKRDEQLIHATLGVNFKTIKRSERSQTQKGHILYDFTYLMFPKDKTTGRRPMSGCREAGVGEEVMGSKYRKKFGRQRKSLVSWLHSDCTPLSVYVMYCNEPYLTMTAFIECEL